uniref:GXGXG motif-containing protein n=1 Tax=Candidatus Kentrum sp. DK TaxID=2126562 RepID=A0A450TLJ6_9GAMM|nr:MAG: GXGXG motif-containing protein [Candidatus Kentron sp. DK]
MSGGIAYILDEKGDFAIRCNRAMVEIEKIAEEPADKEQMNTPEEKRELPKNMPGHDAPRLKTLIERYVRHTGSERDWMILEKLAG